MASGEMLRHFAQFHSGAHGVEWRTDSTQKMSLAFSDWSTINLYTSVIGEWTYFIFCKYKDRDCLKPIGTYIHTYIHTYIRTYIHTYTHTYIHTYVRTLYPYVDWSIYIYIHRLINGRIDELPIDEKEFILRNPVPGGHFCFIVKFPMAPQF